MNIIWAVSLIIYQILILTGVLKVEDFTQLSLTVCLVGILILVSIKR